MTATARRGHGEGSVYCDAANGTWVGAISPGWRELAAVSELRPALTARRRWSWTSSSPRRCSPQRRHGCIRSERNSLPAARSDGAGGSVMS